MKILLVIHGYPMRYNAGSEVYTQSLAQALADRHEVHVFTRQQNKFLPDYVLTEDFDSFEEVFKFHSPGLAPVRDTSGAYHIKPSGQAAYSGRYLNTFGFYERRAAVRTENGWFHIQTSGKRLSDERYAWCGNFQGGRCTVRRFDGLYLHLQPDGKPVYQACYRYTGDYRDGIAVVQGENGLHTHINLHGELLHGSWLIDLDVFHRGLGG